MVDFDLGVISAQILYALILIFNIVYYLMQGLLEARQELRPLISKPNNRLKDLLFLDIALDSAVRTAIERGYEELNTAGPEVISVNLVYTIYVLHYISF